MCLLVLLVRDGCACDVEGRKEGERGACSYTLWRRTPWNLVDSLDLRSRIELLAWWRRTTIEKTSEGPRKCIKALSLRDVAVHG